MSDESSNHNSFSSAGRTLEQENEIELISVGVDIGSSTSHIMFSRITMERFGNRYLVTRRDVQHQSDIILTPYKDDTTIDADALGVFISRQYDLAGLAQDQIDTGALILTGVAVRRSNARAIADLFAHQAGKLVAVSAGDALETTLVAYGSGAVERSRQERIRVMNVDVGGGTSKIAICDNGAITDMTVIDIGARLICLDEHGCVIRLEEAGKRIAAETGLLLDIGIKPGLQALARVVDRMADYLFQAMGADTPTINTDSLLRLDALQDRVKPDIVTFSGGVSEYIYGKETGNYGDLGAMLAVAIRQRVERWEPPLALPQEGIRATVIGASQYTIQVSGNTIFISSDATLPLRNIPVISPPLPLEHERPDVEDIARRIASTLGHMGLPDGNNPVAISFKWHGSATYARLDAVCCGVIQGMAAVLTTGSPLILINDGDVGGLVGLHCHNERQLHNPVISIDGIELKEFDYIDIGALISTSGAVPVVVKSLVFPATTALGR